MTTVSILSFPSELGDGTFRAVAGEHRSSGRTAGEALDALAGQLTPDELTTLVVVQHHQPDRLFTADQRNRLNHLMERWRSARDAVVSCLTTSKRNSTIWLKLNCRQRWSAPLKFQGTRGMNPRYPAVADRAGHRCEYCHAPEVVFNFPFEVEHIVPSSLGGTDGESNLALACRSCNLHKSDCVEAVDPHTDETVSLFHPRRDTWRQNFDVESETGTILGITSIGRATVLQLK